MCSYQLPEKKTNNYSWAENQARSGRNVTSGTRKRSKPLPRTGHIKSSSIDERGGPYHGQVTPLIAQKGNGGLLEKVCKRQRNEEFPEELVKIFT